MDKKFENGKFYKFYKNLWTGIGEIGSFRRVKDSYDIIIDLRKGYYLKLLKGYDYSVVISLNFFYNYGYKNFNQATIECVKEAYADSIPEVLAKIRFFRNLTKSYVKNHKNNIESMLIVQEKEMRKYY